MAINNGNKLKRFSIVIPIRNEEENISILYKEVVKTVEKVDLHFEIIFINDHSNDNSEKLLLDLSAKDKRVKTYTLVDESGKDAALMTGLVRASGEIIITMDGDLQNVPDDIPEMLKLIGEFDMVCGVRVKRKDALLTIVASKVSNIVRNVLTSDSIKDSGCAIRVMKSQCIEHIIECNRILYGCAHYFYPTILRKKGFKVIEVPVQHRKRIYGKSKFKLFRGRIISGIKACFKVNTI